MSESDIFEKVKVNVLEGRNVIVAELEVDKSDTGKIIRIKMKLATWNMAHWTHKKNSSEAWDYFLKNLDCDILLFQEAYPDLNILNQSRLVWNSIGDKRQWGSGIYSMKSKIQECSFKNNFFGSVVASEVSIEKDFNPIVISLYALMEAILGSDYSIPNLHRIFSDLTGLLESRKTKNRIIIGGDFNASLQFDNKNHTHKVFFDRLKEFNLINCFDDYFDDPVQTHRHVNSEKPWQIDYFFMSKELSKKLIGCVVIDNGKIRKFSDHNPVVIELDI